MHPEFRNPPTFAAAVEANLQTGVSLLLHQALVVAIQDRRLQRAHLSVLAAISVFVDTTSARAWPSYAMLADATGLSPKTVANTISELRGMGYLITDRGRVPEAGNRSLTTYTFGNIDHDTIRKVITDFVMKVRDARKEPVQPTSPPEGKLSQSVQLTSPQEGKTTSPPEGKTRATSPQEVIPTSPPAGSSISNNKIPRTDGGGVPATPSRKREASPRTRLKPDWVPSPETIAWVKRHYVATDAQVSQEAQKFRDYHVSKGSTMADWPAAWRTWWGNGFHKIPRRMGAVAELQIASVAGQDREFANALERARLLDEEDDRCRR